MSITYDFKGQVASVTGAASGMGLATARAFAYAGAAVTLADVSEAALQQAVDEITLAGGKAIGVVCDVSDEAQVGLWWNALSLPLVASTLPSTMPASRSHPRRSLTNRRRTMTGSTPSTCAVFGRA